MGKKTESYWLIGGLIGFLVGFLPLFLLGSMGFACWFESPQTCNAILITLTSKILWIASVTGLLIGTLIGWAVGKIKSKK